MRLKHRFKIWKNHFLLLFGIGVSNVGDWIYLISLNLIVLDMTGSPLAVSALYILKPLAALFTNAWAGSVIDRLNKRNLMIILDIIRAILIASLPFFSSIWSMYVVVFLINMASSMFIPTSMTYITKLTPSEQRKRFNSLRSLIESGGFLIGPAIAGILFLIGTPILAIYMNALALFLSGFVTLLLPNLEKQTFTKTMDEKISLELLKNDWKIVIKFSHRYFYITLIYFLFSCMMVMATAVDSLEAAFAKKVLSLSDSEYGFLVSIAGVGIVVGAIVNTIFAKKLATSLLIGLGSLNVSVGYIIYAFSNSFFIAALGFFILSFSLSFANTGFHTFYQNNIPVEVMGRVGSIYGLIKAFLIIITTVIFGIMSQFISIKFIVITGTLIMLLITMMLCLFSLQPSKKKYYLTMTADSTEINNI
ncbi:MFS transporter [Thermaerobacillus caldiproteolyticus]|uniref:MFS family permease n=1 Tax=Thermaerobacillus caldiproteolyticus TaxID=247480 RepID=A0A7V9Z8W9_9BACL|nr:MFS transporter [Anoxybacillus caldiproteolyticus]MBA2876214.1 MFS family permease [Anoxybacillus caldiproteolyticus]